MFLVGQPRHAPIPGAQGPSLPKLFGILSTPKWFDLERPNLVWGRSVFLVNQPQGWGAQRPRNFWDVLHVHTHYDK